MKIVTANRLTDGAVVYRGDLGWTRRFDEAKRLDDELADAALAEAVELKDLLVGAYLVNIDDGGVERRERNRESIRAGGPTVGHSLAWSAG